MSSEKKRPVGRPQTLPDNTELINFKGSNTVTKADLEMEGASIGLGLSSYIRMLLSDHPRRREIRKALGL